MSSPDYSKGYAAGRRKTEGEIERVERATERLISEQSQFWRAVFLAALPQFLARDTWARGKKKMISVPDRIGLAREAADEATRRMQP